MRQCRGELSTPLRIRVAWLSNFVETPSFSCGEAQDKTYWGQIFQNLLDTRYDWFMIDKEDYKEDDNHKEDTDSYFKYRENENAPIYQS